MLIHQAARELEIDQHTLLSYITIFVSAISEIIEEQYKVSGKEEAPGLEYQDIVCLYYLLLVCRETLEPCLFRESLFSLTMGLMLTIFGIDRLELYSISTGWLARKIHLGTQSFTSFVVNFCLAMSDDIDAILTNQGGVYDRSLREISIPYTPTPAL